MQDTVTTLQPNDVFTVEQIAYTRFKFGTDRAYRAKSGSPEGEAGTPWAFPLAAVISDRPQPQEPITARLSFGALVTTPGYGTYRLEPDHNRNVKFVDAG